MRYRSAFAVVLLLVALMVTARANAADSGAQIVDAAWISAIKANDIDAVMKCYAPDAIMWLPDAPTARGAKAIRAAYEGLLSANTVKDATLSEVTYRTVGKASLAWGNFSLTLVPKACGDGRHGIEDFEARAMSVVSPSRHDRDTDRYAIVPRGR